MNYSRSSFFLAILCTILVSASGLVDPEEMEKIAEKIAELRENIQALENITVQMEEAISQAGEMSGQGRKINIGEFFGDGFMGLVLMSSRAEEIIRTKLNSLRNSASTILGKIGAPFVAFPNPGATPLNSNKTEELASSQNRSEILDKLLDAPRAKIYSGANFTGMEEDYELTSPSNIPGGCKNITNSTKSVDPLGTCVRLFEGIACSGNSLAIYPGSSNSANVLKSLLVKASSIGPCFKSEFDFSNFTSTSGQVLITKNTKNPKEIPDYVDANVDNYFSKAKTEDGDFWKINYSDFGDRIKWCEAVISRTSLRNASLSTELQESEKWMFMEKEEGDLLGFVIPPKLGGPSNRTSNIFPQSPANFKEWEDITEQISTYIIEDPSTNARINLTFAYESERATRPQGFYYTVDFYNVLSTPIATQKVMYGFIRN